MAFVKGKSGNPKGRPKGSGKSFDNEVKEMLRNVRNKVFTEKQLIEDLKKVGPTIRLSFYQNTLEFDIPKLSRTELEHDISSMEVPISPWDDPVGVEQLENNNGGTD